MFHMSAARYLHKTFRNSFWGSYHSWKAPAAMFTKIFCASLLSTPLTTNTFIWNALTYNSTQLKWTKFLNATPKDWNCLNYFQTFVIVMFRFTFQLWLGNQQTRLIDLQINNSLSEKWMIMLNYFYTGVINIPELSHQHLMKSCLLQSI